MKEKMREPRQGVNCPMCGAYNYPDVLEDGKIMCKSCRKDMKGYIDAMKQFIEDYSKILKGEDVERT